MASVTFSLKEPNSEEKTPVILFFRYDSQRVKIYTKQSIESLFWDKTKNRVKNTVKVNSQKINEQLKEMESLIFELFDKFLTYYERKPTPSELKTIFHL